MFLGQHPFMLSLLYNPIRVDPVVTTAATVATVTEASPCDTNKVERHKRDKMEKNLILISENI